MNDDNKHYIYLEPEEKVKIQSQREPVKTMNVKKKLYATDEGFQHSVAAGGVR